MITEIKIHTKLRGFGEKGEVMYSSHNRDVCTTLRKGTPCIFMRKNVGCSFNNGYCLPILDNCKGKEKNCEHIIDNFCDAYKNPNYQWLHFKECPLATHIIKDAPKKKEVLDPRKAAKQRRRKG